MLRLTLNVGEKLMIDDEIEITVLEHRRTGKVRLAIQAPRWHKVWRKQIWDALRAQRNGKSASPPPAPEGSS
jgi:carbon storage regulator CsrA